MSRKIYIATSNTHKLSELSNFLAPMFDHVLGLSDFSDYILPEEGGVTFAENALIKARALADYPKHKKQMKNIWVLADDSGLECDDLDGAPGVYSARFAGPGATDATNNQKLMACFRELTHLSRAARFQCVLALISPLGVEQTFSGTCEGRIIFEPKGTFGFGYDPYFYLEEFDQTMAEMTPEQKNRVSHRAKALQELAGKADFSC